MYSHETEIRVRYGETDRMGYVYYGNYALYYEVARVEALREIGFSYKEMEDSGILLPVSEFKVKYLKPAFYDDLLKVKLSINTPPTVRLIFNYEVLNQKGELLNTGEVTLVFLDKETGRPTKCPADMHDKIISYL